MGDPKPNVALLLPMNTPITQLACGYNNRSSESYFSNVEIIGVLPILVGISAVAGIHAEVGEVQASVDGQE